MRSCRPKQQQTIKTQNASHCHFVLISGGHTHTRNVLPVRIRATDLCDGEILESESQRRRRRPAIAQRIASRPREMVMMMLMASPHTHSLTRAVKVLPACEYWMCSWATSKPHTLAIRAAHFARETTHRAHMHCMHITGCAARVAAAAAAVRYVLCTSCDALCRPR